MNLSRREPPDAATQFATLVAACLRRFLAQNDRPAVPETELADLGARFWKAVSREAYRPPADIAWREMPAALVEQLAAEILDDSMAAERRGDLNVPVRQLLKACLQAEPERCRESYREVVGGHCRRQELARARSRISGTHCVDCPHWAALDGDENLILLARAWAEGPAETLSGNQGIFLPEDFRALRTWAIRVAIRPV
ncbi:MAG: hypothetical protein RL324_1307 [Verrucomicrobiota bacterium]